MKYVLQLFCCSMFLSLAGFAQSFAPGALHQLEEHVWVFNGGSGFFVNTLIIESEAGLILIDSQLEDENNLALIVQLQKRFPNAAIKSFIISHAHLDHFIGIPLFKKVYGSFEVIGIKGENEHMKQSIETLWGTYQHLAKKHDIAKTEIVYPTNEISQTLELSFYGKSASLEIVGPNESWTSLIVHFPDSKSVFVGDMYWGDLVIDPEVGATVLGWSAELKRLLKRNIARVIPGHAPVIFSKEDLQTFVANVDQLIETTRTLLQNNITIEEYIVYDFPVEISYFGDKESSLRNIYDEIKTNQ